FINTLPVRVRVEEEAELESWLGGLQEEQARAREYEYAPLVEVQKWSEVPAGEPLFESLVVYENYPVEEGLGAGVEELRVRGEVGIEQTNYPVVVTAEVQGELEVQVRYERRRVEEGAAERMAGHLEAVLEAMAAGGQRRLCELSLLRDAERSAVLGLGNPTSAPLPVTLPLHRLFQQRAARTPLAPALTCEGESLTYAQLEHRARRVAHALRRRGVGPEIRVALCAERSLDLVVGILAILQAGGAYVPVDPTYPAERIAYLLHDSGCAAVLLQDRLRPLLPPLEVPVLSLEEALTEDAGPLPEADVHPENAAYVIYTSGSTGKPKGVVVTHANVVRLFAATEQWFGFGPDDVWTLFHSYAFDFSVWELWGALLYGGRLVVVPFPTSRAPEEFYALLVREGVTVLNQTPSAFRQLAAAEEMLGVSAELALRVVVFGGEALEPRTLRGWMERHGEERPRLVNMYGITETTVHVTFRPLSRADAGPGAGSTVGGAIPDLGVYLLEDSAVPVLVTRERHR
ncbi:MAG TPA: AMP-binding protein, partial [Longimicrobiaceae bacterium]|nr:AMP-binding protein [Longimicrobiaceae bacterium]